MENEKVKYWIELSDYDLKTAEAMLDTKRFLYVGFMCHQAVEKVLKALYAFQSNKIPPYTHDLFQLLKETKLLKDLSVEQNNCINFLQPMNIQARYPAYKDLLSKSLTEEKCKYLIKETEEFTTWIKTKL